MEANINEIKMQVQHMEELYEFIKEIAKTNDDVLVKVYGMSNLRYIIQDNSLKELYDKWYEYQK